MGSGIQAPEWDSYELVYELAEAPLAAYTTDLEVVVDRFRFEEIAMTDFYSLKGTVENTGNQILKRIYMVAILYDQNGHFVGSSEIAAFVDYLDPDFAGIAPGEVLDVYTELYYPEFDQPLDYEVFAIGIPKE
jgi:hypothetical protein